MAICEVCGREVAPIDKVVRGFAASPHYFCSYDHAEQWVEELKTPKKAAAEAVAEAAPVSEGVIAPESPLAEREVAPKRRPGRPKGSKNRS